tara:strand:+ start:111 stop:764 length:654 start_codon:yes stop_codon:yes gene_type:complete
MNDIEILKSKELINYDDSLNLMEKRVNEIFLGKKKELIWFLNHDHIYTQGTSASDAEIINNYLKTPIIKTNRGGKTTYHGPGQRIIYILLNLNKRKKDIRNFISTIEDTIIFLLQRYNIEGKTYKDRVGVWVEKFNNEKLAKEEKIGAIGLRIKKWITFHGLSFNINPNLDYYNSIYGCGLKNYKNTSLEKLGINLSIDEFDKEFLKIFLKKIEKLN